MKLLALIEQIVFNTYEGMVRIMYKEGESENMADLLRALPGVTTVTNAGANAEMGAMTFKIKLITQKTAEEAFEAFKTNAKNKYPGIIKIEIANETIEEK
tara:strand:+ start:157 stop:456 length:300 start_codon:yes stop_codon:yes gene_type:complete